MKNRMTCLAIVCMLLGLISPVFSGEEFTYPDGKVDLVCPTGWKNEITDTALSMASPDGAIQFVFDLMDVEDLKAGLEQAKVEIEKSLGKTTFGEPIEEELAGMPTVTFEGTCSEKGLSVMVSIINTPAENALCVYYFGAKAAEETHAAGIAEVIKGIRPAAPAAPEAAVEEETEE